MERITFKKRTKQEGENWMNKETVMTGEFKMNRTDF